MTLKGVLDRKLFMLVGSLVLKRLGTVFATYLVATGIPADSAGQLLSAIAALLALVSDIAFDQIEKRRVADKATRQLLDAQGKSGNLDDEWRNDFGDPLQRDLENPLSVLRKPLPFRDDLQDLFEKHGH